jgi:hypothetical protein
MNKIWQEELAYHAEGETYFSIAFADRTGIIHTKDIVIIRASFIDPDLIEAEAKDGTKFTILKKDLITAYILNQEFQKAIEVSNNIEKDKYSNT